jgi:hypothetical protein
MELNNCLVIKDEQGEICSMLLEEIFLYCSVPRERVENVKRYGIALVNRVDKNAEP